MNDIPGLPGGLDLSALLEQADGGQPRTRLKAELSSVKLNWGGGVNEVGNAMYILQVMSLDGSLLVDIPMDRTYFMRLRRQMDECHEGVEKLRAEQGNVS